MLRRLQHHINIKIKKLLEKMIFSTLLILTLGLGFIFAFALTQNAIWLVLMWLTGLLYAVFYFTDLMKYSKIVKDLDQDSLNKSIWLSKAYFNS